MIANSILHLVWAKQWWIDFRPLYILPTELIISSHSLSLINRWRRHWYKGHPAKRKKQKLTILKTGINYTPRILPGSILNLIFFFTLFVFIHTRYSCVSSILGCEPKVIWSSPLQAHNVEYPAARFRTVCLDLGKVSTVAVTTRSGHHVWGNEPPSSILSGGIVVVKQVKTKL